MAPHAACLRGILHRTRAAERDHLRRRAGRRREIGTNNPYPCRRPGSDNPHPQPDRIPSNPIPPRNTSPWPRRRPVLVFPGRSLGLGCIPRYFGGRKRLETKRSTGNNRSHRRSGDRR